MSQGVKRQDSILQYQSNKIRKRKLLEALRETKGIIKYAAELCGVSRTYANKLIMSDEKLIQELQQIREGLIDQAEQKVLQYIEEGDKDFLKFYLKTIGKQRGYSEKTELDIKTTNVNFTFNSMEQHIKTPIETEYINIEDEEKEDNNE